VILTIDEHKLNQLGQISENRESCVPYEVNKMTHEQINDMLLMADATALDQRVQPPQKSAKG
jgi:hypothetical protein